MTLKTIKIINIIGVLLLSFLTHFVYDWFPNDLFAIFFPVNESIWEHIKMLFTTILIYGTVDYFLFKIFNIVYNNFFFSLWSTAILSIFIYLSLFLPFYYTIGYSEILVFSVLIITIALIQLISYIILNMKKLNLRNISLVLIAVTYIIFGYLTYYPIETDLFYDKEKEKYGINTYNI